MAESQETRKVVTRSPSRTVGIINCRWFQSRPIEHESDLEKRFIKSALMCSGITELWSQPFTLDLGWGKYTPDFLIRIGQHKLVVEIKPESKVSQFVGQFDTASRKLSARGFQFYVVSEKGIDRPRLCSVAAAVYRYGKAEVPRNEIENVYKYLDKGEELTLSVLEQRARVARKVVLHMVARRWVQIHPEDLIEDQARVSRVEYAPENDLENFEERFQVLPWVDGGATQATRQKRSKDLRRKATSPVGPYVRPPAHLFGQAEPGQSTPIASGCQLQSP